jgi:hypothetical protein
MIEREQVEEMYDEATVLSAEGQNPYPAMTYVDGVKAALDWVLGEGAEPPLELP